LWWLGQHDFSRCWYNRADKTRWKH